MALSAGEAFGTGGAGHVRLNYATSTEVLTAAVSAMGDADRAATARLRGGPVVDAAGASCTAP